MNAPKNPRRPQVFQPDDPAISPAVSPARPPLGDQTAPDAAPSSAPSQADKEAGADTAMATGPVNIGAGRLKRRFGWGALFLSAVGSLVLLAASTWAMRFVSDLLQGDSWISWTAFGLALIASLAALMIALREISGIMRLRQLHRFRADVDLALARRDPVAERKCVRRLKAIYRTRRDMRWSLDRLSAHESDIQDPGDLLLLADRDLLRPLDDQARLTITDTAKRVSLVTAISPIALIDIGYVLVQNLAMLRRLAELYGARPGFLGGLRLAKLVAVHIVATGGLALSDDLFGQILGQDLVRRLSRRLGEGVFNGILSARIGIAAIEVLRPLPNLATKPVRLREMVPLIFKKSEGEDSKSGT